MRKQWRRWFPRLKEGDFEITSPQDRSYNCLAYAAGDLVRVWDPAETPAGSEAFHWPAGVPREHTIGTWQQALASVGFAPVPPDEQEDPGWLRVAIYGQGGKATHAARQLQDGWWSSKLGDLEDIRHRKSWDLSGGIYGEVMLIVVRKRTPDDP